MSDRKKYERKKEMIRAVRVSNEKKMRKNTKSQDVRVIFYR